MLKSDQLPLEAFYHWEHQTAEAVFLRQPIDGIWKTWTWKEAGHEIRKISAALSAYNLRPGSKIAILSKNCAHWVMADLAIMMAGYISVPIYPTLEASTIRQILEHSEAQILFVGKLDKFKKQKPGVPAEMKCISFSCYGQNEGADWDDLLQKYQPLTPDNKAGINDLATIMYTSGTSGKPKGVMITYHAISYTAVNAISDLWIPQHPKLLSYLPMSHIAERIGIEMIGLYTGATFSFAESLELFPKNLSDVQPNLFFAVPRIWAKFQEKILEKMSQKKLDVLLSIPIIKTIIKKSIRKKLGLTDATHIYTGAAPIATSLLLWFDRLGIEIFQAYAMTENTCYGTFNRHGANKYGTVGQVLSGMEIKISDNDEILIRHPALMNGYYKEQELTGESFIDGYFRTGDQGIVDKDGFLSITGRIKDLFKTDKGKYVAPSPIEVLLQQNPDVDQTCVVGMGIPQPIALVVLSPNGKSKTKADIISSLSKSLKEINPTLNAYERIEKAVIMQDDWTIENGLMTPSLKIKRNEVEKIHLPKYPTWYKKEGIVVWE